MNSAGASRCSAAHVDCPLERRSNDDPTVTPERPRYIPLSTYRLQVHAGFPLGAAEQVVSYLAALGVGACYTSPYFTAAPGSTHGYDVRITTRSAPSWAAPRRWRDCTAR